MSDENFKGSTKPTPEPPKSLEMGDIKKNGKVADIEQGVGNGLAKHSSVTLAETQGIRLEFRDLNYTVKLKRNPCMLLKAKVKKNPPPPRTRTILKNLNGCFKPGQMTAIMGSSGAGKSTLLNVLADRVSGKVTGGVYFDGIKRPRNSNRLVSYVTQDDIMLGNLTPKETLTFLSHLQLPHYKRRDRKNRVDNIIHQLGLQRAQNTIVGTPGIQRGLSGGERKRLNIAMALLSQPRLLFLDEPTSGLDSTIAFSLIETLRTLADEGVTIVMTIHQPSALVFQMFDWLYLLADGETVYDGPQENVVDYFAGLGYRCPSLNNPADYVIDLMQAQGQFPPEVRKSLTRELKPWEQDTGRSYEDLYDPHKGPPGLPDRASRMRYLLDSFKETDMHRERSEPVVASKSLVKVPKRHRAWWPVQLFILATRTLKGMSRELLAIRQRVGLTIVMGLLTGLLYLQVDKNQEGVRNRQGAVFFSALNQLTGAMFGVLFVFPKERPVFLRERLDGLYDTSSYFLSKAITDIPMQTLFPTAFMVIAYFLVGFQTKPGNFFIFCASVIGTAFAGSSLGQFISAVVPSTEVALAIAPAMFVPLILFAGFIVSLDQIPVWLRWASYLSPIKYTLEIMFYTEMNGLSGLYCDDEELVNGTICPWTTGDQALTAFNYDDVVVWQNFLFLFVWIFAVRIASIIGLKISERRARKNM